VVKVVAGSDAREAIVSTLFERKPLRTIALAIAALMLWPSASILAQSTDWDPAGFTGSYQLEERYNGLSSPVGIVDPGDGSGRLFIVEKTGTIRVVVDGKVRPTPFLDISDQVSGSSEQGLLGLAFAPDFADSGRFYIDYTDVDGNSVIARYTLSNPAHNQADPATAKTILTQEQPYPNHNGGQILFGPDGDLYIGFGDGGSQGDPNGNGQSLQTWLGKILRIDVSGDGDYAIPADNPYADGVDGLPEIFIYGLRNPWRFSFDAETGDLYIADVGQGQWEEIDMLPAGEQAGANLGWSILEGSHCYQEADCDSSGTVLPIYEYSHDSGCSVTGGFVVHGDTLPGLDGVYLFGDYCTGLLWATARDANSDWQTSDAIETGLSISSFGSGPNGEIYVVDLNGTIYQLVAA
jgi:glucose/arabinose dehydrogenase